MEILITYVMRLAKGGVSRRSEEVSAEVLRFGRSTNAEAYLADPRIRFEHATIRQRPDGLFLEAEKQADLRVNGRPSANMLVKPGDVIGIGPFEVTLTEPPPDKDVAIEIELIRPLGDDYARLARRSTLSLADYGLSRRLWSWVFFLLTAGIFLAAPILFFSRHEEQAADKRPGFRIDTVWNSGQISTPHRFISDQCNTCHQKAFVRVTDGACLSCHERTEHHFDAAKPELADSAMLKEFSARPCGSCHQEHNGDRSLTITRQALCLDCHNRIENILPQSDIRNAGNFDTAHPEFRPELVVDSKKGVTRRVSLDDKEALVEKSGLKFPHAKHLAREGIRGPKGKEVLECANCHHLPRGAAGFLPIGMEGECERCHSLAFDPRRPDRTLPHGQVENAQILIREFYSDFALHGGMDDAPVSPPEILRRRPGQREESTPVVRSNPKDWADQQAQRIADQSFGKTMCGNCHVVSNNPGAGPLNWSVIPAMVTKNWLPRGRFDHSAHQDMLQCGACHDAENSAKATDVLLPKIAVCKQCHGGEDADNKTPSTCITCHDFHLPGRPRMTAKEEVRMMRPDISPSPAPSSQ